MKTKILLAISLIFASVSLAFAEPQVVTLKDGSQLKGELVSVSPDGSYTIRTGTMGDVKVSSSQVASITSQNVVMAQAPANQAAPNAAGGNGELNQRIQAAQSKLMSDPQMMSQLQEMMQDPELMQLLSDPTVTKAVMAHDVEALQNNPKAKKLMDHPKMKALMDQLRQ